MGLLLLAAINAGLWLVIFGVIYRAAGQQQALQQELRRLEAQTATETDDTQEDVRNR